jgi:hypothetical protein
VKQSKWAVKLKATVSFAIYSDRSFGLGNTFEFNTPLSHERAGTGTGSYSFREFTTPLADF